MERFKENWGKLKPYFIDIWQYLLLIIIFIIAAIFVL